MKRVLSFLLFFSFLSASLFATDDIIPEVPKPARLVNNFSKEMPNFLSKSEQESLEQKLVAFNDSTSNQIVIVIVDDLGGYQPYEYASRLGNKWGIGQKKLKNGLLILIKPTGGQGNRVIFISPSAGLQGAIPDAATSKIVNKEIVPEFKSGNYFEGLNKATDVLMALAAGEYKYTEYARSGKKIGTPLIAIVLILLFIIIRAISMRNRHYTIGRGGRGYSSGGWFIGGGGSSWGGGSSSGGGFGGFGGGGGFSGGGSGGSW